MNTGKKCLLGGWNGTLQLIGYEVGDKAKSQAGFV